MVREMVHCLTVYISFFIQVLSYSRRHTSHLRIQRYLTANMYRSIFALLTSTLILITVDPAFALLTASTPAGTVHGSQCPSSSATSFLSIPYAQPPVNDLRFQATKPFNSSFAGGTLNATTAAPSCTQFGSRFIEQGRQSEDW